MSQDETDSKDRESGTGSSLSGQTEESETAPHELSVSAWTAPEHLVPRRFPGPVHTDVLLRVAVEREAYAELNAHAVESLDEEVCGVLAGEVCEDEAGLFVHVRAAIRGASVRTGSSHVTYTQETWNQIHETMEREHPSLRIVGWYHSHPGFGVEFSDMDLFIQENFFSGLGQIALVGDPLSGDVAICVNTSNGVRNIERFWVDGRERPCRMPAHVSNGSRATGAASDEAIENLESLEVRVNQLTKGVDDLRLTIHRTLLSLIMLVSVGIVLALGFYIYSIYARPYTPPEHLAWAPVPLNIDGKPILLGLRLFAWPIPPELLRVLPDLDGGKADGSSKDDVLRKFIPKLEEPVDNSRTDSDSSQQGRTDGAPRPPNSVRPSAPDGAASKNSKPPSSSRSGSKLDQKGIKE